LNCFAPARTADIGIEAVNHGADAVYIGGPGFGARSSADNSVADIARLVRHAHRWHSRIFVTLNTILHDEELEPARRLAWQLFDAGVDALIIQDMGLLELDLPPIQLHASTQTDIRTPEKARFLQDAGLSQLVLARELTLEQIRAVRAATHCTLEYFVHGALCVAYSGQCYISQAHTGRSANRGECSQACRLPYKVIDAQGRFVAHDKHVLSMKDNNQSDNLAALVDAGIRSFKIEGRYKDLGYVKNITGHYRVLLDALMEQRAAADSLWHAQQRAYPAALRAGPEPELQPRIHRLFRQRPARRHRRLRQPEEPGPADRLCRAGWYRLDRAAPGRPRLALHNGDGLCYYDLQKELAGLAINRAEADQREDRPLARIPEGPGGQPQGPAPRRGSQPQPRCPLAASAGQALRRTPHRCVDAPGRPRRGQAAACLLTLTDEDGCTTTVRHPACPARRRKTPRRPPAAPASSLTDWAPRSSRRSRSNVGRDPGPLRAGVGAQCLAPRRGRGTGGRASAQPAATCRAPSRWSPPCPTQEQHLSYLANVLNSAARRFYERHGVQLIAPAYEAIEEPGEVSLMITKHCVRFSLSLCPKQAKGVTGVQGTVRAEPLQLVNGKEKLTLRFDCKPCEMHVVGRMKPGIAAQAKRERGPGRRGGGAGDRVSEPARGDGRPRPLSRSAATHLYTRGSLRSGMRTASGRGGRS
jgi:collagenase-like PrtC family protease